MQIKNRNLFRATRFILLNLPWLLKIFTKTRTPRKRLLLVKIDAIGDYILSRNFIEIVRASEKFSGYQIDLIGNELWRDIALKHDSIFVDNFYFIRPDELYESPVQTLKLAFKLFSNRYEVVLQSTFSRTFIGDGLAGFAAAEQTIAFESDTERIDPKYKSKTDRFYSELLTIPTIMLFEFDRSKFFFETVLQQPAYIVASPFLDIEHGKKSGIVIFPGAGVSKRSWEPGKFVELIKLLSKETSHNIWLAGDAADEKSGVLIAQMLPLGTASDLTGKTSLVQLIELIANASLVIGNETSAIHIAAAVKKNSVCILGGGHFERFAPYHPDVTFAPVCVFEKMDCYCCNWNCKFKIADGESFPCISSVKVADVFKAVQQLL